MLLKHPIRIPPHHSVKEIRQCMAILVNQPQPLLLRPATLKNVGVLMFSWYISLNFMGPFVNLDIKNNLWVFA